MAGLGAVTLDYVFDGPCCSDRGALRRALRRSEGLPILYGDSYSTVIIAPSKPRFCGVASRA